MNWRDLLQSFGRFDTTNLGVMCALLDALVCEAQVQRSGLQWSAVRRGEVICGVVGHLPTSAGAVRAGFVGPVNKRERWKVAVVGLRADHGAEREDDDAWGS